MGSPLFLLRDEPQLFAAFVIAVIVAIPLPEFSHAAVASLQGDQTARAQGRLTLNPLAHLDPLGSIALIVAGFGWGRPVALPPSPLRNPPLGHALVGRGGPARQFYPGFRSGGRPPQRLPACGSDLRCQLHPETPGYAGRRE